MPHRPALGKVPGVGQDDLVLKASATGITFLHDRRYRQRYTGSKTCAIDINGEFWQSANELKKEIKPKEVVKGKGKKKAPPSGCQMLLDANPKFGSGCEPGAISNEIYNSANISPETAADFENISKKPRKNSYSVNKKEVRQRILGYINTMKGQKELYFWTVSFPEGTPDDTCYQAFNTWLTTLRTRRKDKFGKLMPPMLKEYLWIAERQLGKRSAPGKAPTYTIHFHIAIPHYMNVQRVNAAMRGILKNLSKKGLLPGAVCDPRTGDTYYLPSIARYNGVDICKHRTTRRVVNFAVKKGSRALATYLTKYVTKNEAGVPDENGNVTVPAFTHLAWHNSRGFSCLFTAVTFTIKEFTEKGFKPFLNGVRQFRMNFATFIPWLFGPPPLLLDHLYKLNSYVQQSLFNE